MLGADIPQVPAASFQRLYDADRSDLPEPVYVTLRDGFRLAYRSYPGAAERAVVLLHGAAGHSAHMHTLSRAIADARLATVYAIDIRGHGLSGGPAGHAVTGFDVLRDDVLEVIETVRVGQPGAFVVLGGFSAGGGLAVRVAESAGQLVDGYLLLAPYLGAAAPSTRPSIGGWARPNLVRMASLVTLNSLGIRRFNNRTVVAFSQPETPRDGLEALRWSFCTAIAFGPRSWKRGLAAIRPRHPLLIVVGDRDDCFYPSSYAPMVAAHAPHGSVRHVADCGHWDVLVLPAALEAMTTWLAGLP
jgi:pimeloyl-ACP methyl ester carboxylesterase